MEVVELKKFIKKLLDSPHYHEFPKEVPQVVKIGLETSWLSNMFIKPEKVVIKRLDHEDPEKIKLIDKLQEDMHDYKLTFEALRN